MAVVSQVPNDDPYGLDDLVVELQRCGHDAAVAEAEYRKQEALKTLELKATGMAIGVIDKVVRGDEKVNLALLQWRAAEVEYKAAAEALNVAKIKAKERNNVARAEYYA